MLTLNSFVLAVVEWIDGAAPSRSEILARRSATSLAGRLDPGIGQPISGLQVRLSRPRADRRMQREKGPTPSVSTRVPGPDRPGNRHDASRGVCKAVQRRCGIQLHEGSLPRDSAIARTASLPPSPSSRGHFEKTVAPGVVRLRPSFEKPRHERPSFRRATARRSCVSAS
jgi:hypothetical protein